jgi:hypothetical protein
VWTGAEGAVIDSVTGDFLFSTFGAANHVIAVRGFAIPNTPTPGAGATATATPTRTQTPIVSGVPAVVPTLSLPMLVLLGAMLAGGAFWVIARRS